MKTRGELLKSRREALGFTQQDVASRLHIEVSHGRRTPPPVEEGIA